MNIAYRVFISMQACVCDTYVTSFELTILLSTVMLIVMIVRCKCDKSEIIIDLCLKYLSNLSLKIFIDRANATSLGKLIDRLTTLNEKK